MVCKHIVVYKGDMKNGDPVHVRVHAENVLGDVFRSTDKPSGVLIERALRTIDEIGCGALVYLQHDDMEKSIFRSPWTKKTMVWERKFFVLWA